MNTEQLRKLIAEDKIIIGKSAAKKALHEGSAKQLLIAENARSTDIDQMTSYAQMAKVDVTSMEVSNKQLGTMCRKPFRISFLAVTK